MIAPHIMLRLTLLLTLLIQAVNLTEVTYYEVLGVTKEATSQEIRHAYKKLAVKLHPDKNPNAEDQEKFLKLTEAYETLKDPDKRHKYDTYGSYPSYTKTYDYHSQSEYNNLFYNGLYHDDPYVDTLSGASFYNYLQDGFHFINFYSPFCPPCQNLVDTWKKLADVYKGIVKVGAVNCKHHNSFCYNSMRIGSYPSLLFYPNGKNGNFIYYRGDRTYDALEKFIMNYLKSRLHIPTVSQLRHTDKPMAYILGINRIENNVLTRIAFQMKGLVTIAIVEDESLRSKLTKDEYTTVVLKYKNTIKELQSIEEKDLLNEIVEGLPRLELIEPDKLKQIRNELRSGHTTPWVLYFFSENGDRLQLHQLRLAYTDMHFGEIDCDKWGDLCISLQVESAPAWGVLKPGGAYQLVRDVRTQLDVAAAAIRLHSLSASELTKILDGEVGTWVLVIVPYQLSWDHIVAPFTQASLRFKHDDISFGIMECTQHNDKNCRRLAPTHPQILVQEGDKRHAYNGQMGEREIIEFIELLRDSADIELNEHQILEVTDPGRSHTWLVAFLPSTCGTLCDELEYQWRLVAKKLRPLEFVRVGALRCSSQSSGFCANVRSPTARLYPLASGHHYTVSLQNLAQAPYILEWALSFIDDTVEKLNWNSFANNVIAEELNPKSGKKPWLVYFHSPRCHRCYEMYADFAIAAIQLRNAVHLGKVNCVNERGLCQNEQIMSYPSLKLYLGRNKQHKFSSVISLQMKDYVSMLKEIKAHLRHYDESLLAGIDVGARAQAFHIKHDEF